MDKKVPKIIGGLSEVKLLDKQSVRTTFSFSEKGIDAIDWLMKRNNLKPKELFDIIPSSKEFVDYSVKEALNSKKDTTEKRSRKTYVISKNALRLFNKLSKENEISRDIIAEKLILSLKIILNAQSDNEKKQEEKALAIINELIEHKLLVEKELQKLLMEDNPILSRFSIGIIIDQNLSSAIDHKLKDGIAIDPDDYSQSC